MRLLLAVCALALLGSPMPAPAPSNSGSFQLKVFKGFAFGSQQVVESSSSVDLTFTYQVRRTGMISYLGANRIKRLETRPTGLTRAEVATWKDYVAGPAPGYYVIESRDGKHHYQLRLKSFENQGKAASYWLMTFDWEEITL